MTKVKPISRACTSVLVLTRLQVEQSWQPLTRQPAPNTWLGELHYPADASPPTAAPQPAAADAPPHTVTAAMLCKLMTPGTHKMHEQGHADMPCMLMPSVYTKDRLEQGSA